jgi:hypothetical protein
MCVRRRKLSHGRDHDVNNQTEHKPKTDRSPTRQSISTVFLDENDEKKNKSRKTKKRKIKNKILLICYS